MPSATVVDRPPLDIVSAHRSHPAAMLFSSIICFET